jgi:hypothetical protein
MKFHLNKTNITLGHYSGNTSVSNVSRHMLQFITFPLLHVQKVAVEKEFKLGTLSSSPSQIVSSDEGATLVLLSKYPI